jgi:hypothetical protein
MKAVSILKNCQPRRNFGFNMTKTPKPGTYQAAPEIKRFYKNVDVSEHPLSESSNLSPDAKIDYTNMSKANQFWAVTLDGKVI